jgi:hypothetical protein
MGQKEGKSYSACHTKVGCRGRSPSSDCCARAMVPVLSPGSRAEHAAECITGGYRPKKNPFDSEGVFEELHAGQRVTEMVAPCSAEGAATVMRFPDFMIVYFVLVGVAPLGSAGIATT